jgi:hypothetical protein
MKGVFKAIRFISRIFIIDLSSPYNKGLCYGSVDKILHNKIKRG